MKKISGLLLTIFTLFILFPTKSMADVNVQGTLMSDSDYQELVDSLPDGAYILSNEEMNISPLSRASSKVFTHQAHVQTLGWLPIRDQFYVAGTTGRNLALEAIAMDLPSYNTSIKYRAHVRNIGWQSWKYNGQIAGTTGRNLPMEGLEITTTGNMGLIYRAHVQNLGWLPWVRSWQGDYAGTVGQVRHIEAIEFIVVNNI